MFRHSQVRKVLPLLQTVIAISFGGWGLWIRNSILSRTFLGGSTGWDSTLHFHVWPWPLKFAAIVNLPALLAGAVIISSLGYFRTRFSGWAWTIPTVLCVSLLWYWLGRRVDKSVAVEERPRGERRVWLLLLLFMLICATVASTDELAGIHTIWVLFGIGIWLLVGLAISILWSRRAKRA
jgi:hypothetical protein